MHNHSIIPRLSALIVIVSLLAGCNSFATFAPTPATPTISLTQIQSFTPTAETEVIPGNISPPPFIEVSTAEATLEPTLTPTLESTLSGQWERFGDSNTYVYRDSSGKVEIAKNGSTEYAAELVEVEGLPSILICISKEKVINTFDNGRIGLNTDLYPDAAMRIENSYLGSLAMAYFKGKGNNNPSLDDIANKVAEFKETLKAGKKLEGINFINSRGESFDLTGQPVQIVLNDFTTNNPGWDAVSGMFTYRFDISPNELVVRIFQTDMNVEAWGNGIYEDIEYEGLSSEKIREMKSQINFSNNYILSLRLLGGESFYNTIQLHLQKQLEIPSMAYLLQEVDPNFVNWVNTERDIWLPEFNDAVSKGDKDLIKKLIDDKDIPYSYYSNNNKYAGTSVFEIVDFDPSRLDFI